MSHIPLLFFLALSACSSGGWRPTAPPTSTPASIPPPPPDRPIPPNIIRSQYELQWSAPVPHGLNGELDGSWVGAAAYDFNAGAPIPNWLEFQAPLRTPRASNAIYGLHFDADATPKPAKVCAVGDRAGDEVPDSRAGHTGSACVPWSVAVTVSDFASGGAWTTPSVAIAMPQEHSYMVTGDSVTLKILVLGTVRLQPRGLHLYVDEAK